VDNQSNFDNAAGPSLAAVPAVRSFEFDDTAIGAIKTNINPFRGAAAIPIDLVALPGRPGLDVKVSIFYASNVASDVQAWNIDSPTGIVGLGWQMPFDRIVVNQGDSGSDSSAQYYLLSNGSGTPLVQTGTRGGTVWLFQARNYEFWDISYDTISELWTIVKENGFIYLYGGNGQRGTAAASAQGVQYGVEWANWIGSSARTDGQQQFATGWNLTAIVSSTGSTVTYEYDAVTAQVGAGGQTYTQASYLSKIHDSLGRTVTFSYEEKYGPDDPGPGGVVEYQPANAQQTEPNAYQDVYETRYLKKIIVENETGNLLFNVIFDYDFVNFAPPGPYNSLFGKRVLTAAWQEGPLGQSLPAMQFAYNPAAVTNPGALASITYPEGGVASFTYKPVAMETSASLTVYNPIAGSVPRVWHGDDYVVTTFCGSSGMRVLVSSWNGRWVSFDVSAPAMSSLSANSGTLVVVTQPNYFAVFARNTKSPQDLLFIYTKNPSSFGGFNLYSQSSIALKSSSAPVSQIAAGADYIVAYNSQFTQGPFQGWSYSWSTQSWTTPPLPPASLSTNATGVSLAGSEHYYIVFSYTAPTSGAGPGKGTIMIYYRQLDGSWQYTGPYYTSQTVYVENGSMLFRWSLAGSLAVATYVTDASQSSVSYNLAMYTWNGQFYLNPSTPTVFSLTSPVQNGKPVYDIFNTAVNGALVSNAYGNYRYVGGAPGSANWASQTLNPQGSTPQFAWGEDVALMCGSSNQLWTFNPNYPGNGWGQQNTSSGGNPTVSGNYCTVGSQILFRNVQGAWSALSTQMNNPVSGSVQNRGPNYIAYQTGSGAAASGAVIMLGNGAAAAPVPLSSQMVYVPGSSAPGATLAGPRFLVTYPASQSFDAASSLTIYGLDGGGPYSQATDYPVATVKIADAFEAANSYVASFYYSNSDTSQIGYNSLTGLAQYPQVLMAPGVNDGGPTPPDALPQGSTTYFYSNGLSPYSYASQGQVYNYDSILNGYLLAQIDRDARGNEVSSQFNNWNVIRQDGNGNYLYGAYVRLQSSQASRDGVQQASSSTYDQQTGLPLETSQSFYDSQGNSKALVTRTLYAWQAYGDQAPFSQQHLYTPVAQTTKLVVDNGSGANSYIQSDVTTYKDWAPTGSKAPLWDVWQTYRWTAPGDTPPAFNFQSGANPDWLATSVVQGRYMPYSLVQQISDVTQTPQSFLYDKSFRYTIASFPNGATLGQEVSYYGFESYEDAQGWALGASASIIPNGTVTAADAHTGVSSLMLSQTPNGQYGIRNSFAPARWNLPYVFSAWVKLPAGFNSSNGRASWTVQPSTGAAITVDFPATVGKWTYMQIPIPASSAAVTYQISAVNANPSSVLVDNLRFSPLSSICSARALDSYYLLPNAEMGPNGECSRAVLGEFGQTIATTNAADATASLSARYFSRQGNQNTFSITDPNCNLSIQCAGGGALCNFNAGSEWQSLWQPGAGDTWTVSNGRLTLQQFSGRATLTLQNPPANAGYCVRARVGAAQTASGAFGIACGSSVTIEWNPSASQWQLTANQTTIPGPTGGSGIPGDWLLSVTGNVLLFYCNGQRIFSYVASSAIAGAPQLFFSSPVTIAALLSGYSPQVAVQFLDSAGTPRQAQGLTGAQAVASQTFLDNMGRQAISTKSAYIAPGSTQLMAYSTSFAAFDWKTQTITGLVNDAYPADQGYPYTRQAFEPSPLARVIERGLPGAPFAVGAHSTKYAYSANTASSGLPANQYFVATTTDPNGNLTSQMSTALNQVVGKISINQTPNGPVQIQNSTQFSDAGFPAKLFAPDYYAPPAGSSASDWIVQQTFDFAGRVIQAQSVGQNAATLTTNYIYDAAGNLRFMQDPQGAAAGNYNYCKYDGIGRMIETGYLAGAWNQQALENYAASDPAWPPTPSTWRKQFFYDGLPAYSANSIGRLSQALSNNAGSGTADVTETAAYDVSGNRLQVTQAASGFQSGQTYTFAYAYDALGNILRITYPAQAGAGALDVYYRYNQLSQLVTMAQTADFSNPMASFTYEPNGRPLAQAVYTPGGATLTTQFGFNSPLWIASLACTQGGQTVFSEALQYTSGGVNGSGFYNGQVASASFQAGGAVPSYDVQFGYNSLGAIGASTCPAQPNREIQSVGYDANGNIETFQQGGAAALYTPFQHTQQIQKVTNSATGAIYSQYLYDQNGNATQANLAKSVSGPHNLSIVNDPATKMATSITDSAGSSPVTLQFTYGGRGQRVVKSVAQGGSQPSVKLYLFGTNSYPLAEITVDASTGNTTGTRYIYGPGGLLAMSQAGNFYPVVRDHLGSVRVVLNQAGGVAAWYDYLAFGTLAQWMEPQRGFMPYLFTGQELDWETSLYNYRARFYNSDLGRFLSTDPSNQFFSPYIYASNNPVLYVDPTGRFSIASFFSAIVGAIIGAVEVLIGVVIDIVAGIAEAITGGLSTPVSVMLASLAGAFYGAGASAITYSVTHFTDFSWKDYAIDTGIGLVTGAITFGFGELGAGVAEAATGVKAAGEAATTAAKVGSKAIEAGFQTVGGGVSAGVGTLLQDAAAGQAPGADLGWSMLWGSVTGFASFAAPSLDYKAGWGELGKRLVANVAVNTVIGVPATISQNLTSGSKWDAGLLDSVASGVVWGGIGSLQTKTAAKTATEDALAPLRMLAFG